MCVSNKRTATNIPETKYLLHQLFKDHLISSLFPVLKWIHFLISVFFYKIGIHLFSCFMDFMQKKKKNWRSGSEIFRCKRTDGRTPFLCPLKSENIGLSQVFRFFCFCFCFLFCFVFFGGGGGRGCIPFSGSHSF